MRSSGYSDERLRGRLRLAPAVSAGGAARRLVPRGTSGAAAARRRPRQRNRPLDPGLGRSSRRGRGSRGEPGDVRAGRSRDLARRTSASSRRTRRRRACPTAWPTSSPARSPSTGWSRSRRSPRRRGFSGPGGVFAAYDYDWPPVVHWEVEAAFEELLRRVGRLRSGPRGRCATRRRHLERMRASGRFRHVREVVLHSRERGSAERIVGMALSLGPMVVLLQEGTSRGRDRARGAARSRRPGPWRARGRDLPRLSRPPGGQMTYSVTLERGTDGTYLAWVDDLPGCAVRARSRAEVLAEACPTPSRRSSPGPDRRHPIPSTDRDRGLRGCWLISVSRRVTLR